VLVLIETDSEEEQCLRLSLNQIKWEEVVEEEEEKEGQCWLLRECGLLKASSLNYQEGFPLLLLLLLRIIMAFLV
jgi:hypothetical protein